MGGAARVGEKSCAMRVIAWASFEKSITDADYKRKIAW